MPVAEALARLGESLSGAVHADEAMSRHTTYHIGGSAAVFAECDTIADVASALTILAEEDVPWTVLGKGSNILVSDSGYPGAVLVLGRDFKRHSVDETCIRAGAGVLLAVVVQDAFRKGLAGLEFAVGVPGTVGGAIAMNAGSREEWIGSIVDTVTIYEPSTGLVGLRGSQIGWGYRTSGLAGRGIVLEASLRMEVAEPDVIRRVMEASLNRRKRSQPLGMPSAGSVFVNPVGDSAGRLIEEAGLKGTRVGGAQISEVHANFIVNTGNATASDVIGLIRTTRDTIKDRYGIELEPEIRFLGSFNDA